MKDLSMSKIQDIKYYCDTKRHLVCWPYSIENLHIMAKDLGIPPHFFHAGKRNRKKPHYDIPARRIKEITAKCILVSDRDILLIIKENKCPN